MRTSHSPLFVFAGVGLTVVVMAGVLGYYIGRREAQMPIATGGSQPTGSKPGTQNTGHVMAPELDQKYADWGWYELPTIGVRFALPQRVARLGEFTEEFSQGEVGMQLCGQFAKAMTLIPQAYAGGGCGTKPNPYLSIGTTSVDFVAGREMGPLDLQGFTFQNGVYAVKTVASQLYTPPQDELEMRVNSHAVELLIVKGNPSHADEGPTLMSAFANRWGVVLNTKNSTFPGLTFLLEAKNGLTEAEFELFLDSIEVYQL